MQLIQQELLLLSLIALGRSNLTNHKNATRFFYCFHDLLISVARSGPFGPLLLFYPLPFTHCHYPLHTHALPPLSRVATATYTITHCPHPRGLPSPHSHAPTLAGTHDTQPLVSRGATTARPHPRGVHHHTPPHSRVAIPVHGLLRHL